MGDNNKSYCDYEKLTGKKNAIFEAFPDLLIITNAAGEIIDYSKGREFGLELEETWDLNSIAVKPEWISEFLNANIKDVFENKAAKIYVHDFQENGINRFCEIRAVPCSEKEFLFVFRDVTKHITSKDKILDLKSILNKSEFTFQALFEGSSDAIFILSNNRVIEYNSAATELLGYGENESISGKTIWELSPEFQPEGMLSEEKVFIISEIVKKNGKHKFEWWLKKSDNTTLPVEIMLTSITLNGKVVFHASCRNISDRKQMECKLEYLSYHDELTGLYNRRFFEEEFKRLDVPRNYPLTLVIGDVNGLKLVNDSLGHLIGDQVIKKMAEIITEVCRSDDIIARLGGDEYVILLPQTTSQEAKKIVGRIKSISSGVKVGSINISASFGWETKNLETQDRQTIFKKAEDYMYKQKLFESPYFKGKTINLIINSLFKRNKNEEAHSRRVSNLCEKLGTELNLSKEEVEELKNVGLVHNIGEIAIEEDILNKQGALSIEEWEKIKRHPEIGYRILSTVNELSEMAEYVLAHHERWNGEGYPKGLRGEDIPLQSRIISIVDAYDAMTNDRTYKRIFPFKDAVTELEKNAGTQFDPKLVNIFITKVLRKL